MRRPEVVIVPQSLLYHRQFTTRIWREEEVYDSSYMASSWLREIIVKFPALTRMPEPRDRCAEGAGFDAKEKTQPLGLGFTSLIVRSVGAAPTGSIPCASRTGVPAMSLLVSYRS